MKSLLVEKTQRDKLKRDLTYLATWDLTQRQLCDLELLLNGAFSPLTGFMPSSEYELVCREMHLEDGTLWPIPVTLDVTAEFASNISIRERIALRHPEGIILAVLTIDEIWKPNLKEEAKLVYGTTDENHPGVFRLLRQTNPVYVSGPIQGIELPTNHTFTELRHTPNQMRRLFIQKGWNRIVAFQTRNPMHRAHVELTRRASSLSGASLLIHPVVGQTSPGDADYFTRVRCYQAALRRYSEQTAMLSLLPLAMRMAGPKEALWHAIIMKNFGCSHFIIGRDHAGPGLDRNGRAYYPPYAAQELFLEHREELEIQMVAFEEMVYVEKMAKYMPRSEVPPGSSVLTLSGTELKRLLQEGAEVPEWFSYPELIAELRRSYPPKTQQGFTVFFTGLSGAGKSTIANVLMAKLMEIGSRTVTLLDGDIVRKHLSSELGFSKEHRDLNIRRIGFVASEITKNRGIAICAPIAPYEATRREVREMITQVGGFVEAYVSTPLEICESRDRKGLYAKARAGIIKNFTGIDDPYEAPKKCEVTIDTSIVSAEEAALEILFFLQKSGYINDFPDLIGYV